MSALKMRCGANGRVVGAHTETRAKRRYGHGQQSRRTHYHLTDTVHLSWSHGRLWGCSARWQCGASSTRPTLLHEPPERMSPCRECFDVRPKENAA